ncbi:hypothetical protein B0G69_7556 [Paraburkholderia sp. RAU2J]|nr:hypothetical protein B0G69_7556 [Paraburkholderia sp. RAU2J]
MLKISTQDRLPLRASTRFPEKLTFMSTSAARSGVALQPAPLETLAIPAALDGRTGSNRAIGGHAQIAAANDLEAIQAWLARFADKPATFDSYRKEAERPLYVANSDPADGQSARPYLHPERRRNLALRHHRPPGISSIASFGQRRRVLIRAGVKRVSHRLRLHPRCRRSILLLGPSVRPTGARQWPALLLHSPRAVGKQCRLG